MAEELIIVVLCDVHMRAGERVEGVTYRFGDDRIDLCESHGSAVREAVALVAEYGRKDAPTLPPTAPGELRCPECGKSFRGNSGLGAHRQRAHGVIGAHRQAKIDRDAARNGRRSEVAK